MSSEKEVNLADILRRYAFIRVDATAAMEYVVTVTREPSLFDADVAESSTTLRHTATLPAVDDADRITWSTASRGSLSNTVGFSTAVTSQYSDIKPEMNCGVADVSNKESAERDKCQTVHDQSLQRVISVNDFSI